MHLFGIKINVPLIIYSKYIKNEAIYVIKP